MGALSSVAERIFRYLLIGFGILTIELIDFERPGFFLMSHGQFPE